MTSAVQKFWNSTSNRKSGVQIPADIGGMMIDKFTIGILLFSFVLSISIVIYEAGRIEDLEERIAVLSVQTKEAEKNSRIARQDAEFVLKLITKGE